HAAGRRHDVRRIPGKEYTVTAESIGDEFGATPRQHGVNLERDIVAAERAPHPGRRVQFIQIELFRRAEDGEAPEVLAVDDGPVAPGPFRTDEDIAFRLVLADAREQILDLDHDADRIAQL